MTFHNKFAPSPAALTQVIVVLNTVTTHDPATNSVPLGPYVALTGLLVVGPKFEPLNVTVSPPAVNIVPDSPEIVGDP